MEKIDEILAIYDYPIEAVPEQGVLTPMLLRVTEGMTSGSVWLSLFLDGSEEPLL